MATHRRRRATRGAALAEAAVVMPVLCMFLGLFMWVKKSYDTRISMQNRTQRDVNYNAGHACRKSTSSVEAIDNPGGIPRRCSGASETPSTDTSSATSRQCAKVAVSAYDRTVCAQSTRLCDEMASDNALPSAIDHAGDSFANYHNVNPDLSEGCE
jgi:hypothetical protein